MEENYSAFFGGETDFSNYSTKYFSQIFHLFKLESFGDRVKISFHSSCVLSFKCKFYFGCYFSHLLLFLIFFKHSLFARFIALKTNIKCSLKCNYRLKIIKHSIARDSEYPKQTLSKKPIAIKLLR